MLVALRFSEKQNVAAYLLYRTNGCARRVVFNAKSTVESIDGSTFSEKTLQNKGQVSEGIVVKVRGMSVNRDMQLSLIHSRE